MLIVFFRREEPRMKLELVSVDRQKPPIVLHQFPVIVGLDPSADVCLDDSAVGHYQCMIDDSDGVLMVWDLGTKLGTTINGVRISRQATLMSGDELGIGKNCFVARYDDGAVKPARHVEHVGHSGSHPPALSHRRRQPATSS
jgi:pSer/pThr/pTyr-binding forkhead associated (FHA) protein